MSSALPRFESIELGNLNIAIFVPVLDWDGQRNADSSMICAFLDQQVPDPPLYPTDPRDAALARL